jgi:FkbM family methyltransferase
MLNKKLITSQGKELHIASDDEVIVDWFSRPADTHTDIIIDQINQGMYNQFLKGTDLTIVDCGANIGLWTLYAQDSCSKIVSVEPAPHNCYIFEQLTSGYKNITLDMSALSMEDGSIKLAIHSSPTCNSIVYDSDTDVAIDVETKTMATIIKQHNLDHVDFVKCDIEGAEILAFTEDTLDAVKHQVGSWLIECHKTDGAMWPGNLELNRQNIMAVLRNAGYSTESIIHDQIYAWK